MINDNYSEMILRDVYKPEKESDKFYWVHLRIFFSTRSGELQLFLINYRRSGHGTAGLINGCRHWDTFVNYFN